MISSQRALSKINVLILLAIFLTYGNISAQETTEQVIQKYGQKGRPEQAISVNFSPNDATAYYKRGCAYYNKGDFDQAISDFTKAIEIYNDYAEAYCRRGLAYYSKGDFDQAITDYTKAIKIGPFYAEAYNNRGLAYNMEGNLEQAIADYTKAIQNDVNYGDAYNNRALAYYLQQEYLRSWNDVHKLEALGYKIPPDFLEDLKKASGRMIYHDTAQDR